MFDITGLARKSEWALGSDAPLSITLNINLSHAVTDGDRRSIANAVMQRLRTMDPIKVDMGRDKIFTVIF